MLNPEQINEGRRLEEKATKDWCAEEDISECWNGCTPTGCHGHENGLYRLIGPDYDDDGLFTNKYDAKLIVFLRNHAKELLNAAEWAFSHGYEDKE